MKKRRKGIVLYKGIFRKPSVDVRWYELLNELALELVAENSRLTRKPPL
jgi:hypothetical protein